MSLLIDKQEFEKAKKILPEAEKNIRKLLEQNTECADAYALLVGTILLGGNIDEAISYYKKAINQIEIKKQDKNNWQYINAMVWLAISNDKKGENDKV